MKSERLARKDWVLAITFSVVLIFLRGTFNSIFWFFWNGLIIVLAFAYAQWASYQRRWILHSFALIGIGIGVHYLVMIMGIRGGRCDAPNSSSIVEWMSQADSCIEYSDPLLLQAQAAVIAGSFLVLMRVIWWLGMLRYRHQRGEDL